MGHIPLLVANAFKLHSRARVAQPRLSRIGGPSGRKFCFSVVETSSQELAPRFRSRYHMIAYEYRSAVEMLPSKRCECRSRTGQRAKLRTQYQQLLDGIYLASAICALANTHQTLL